MNKIRINETKQMCSYYECGKAIFISSGIIISPPWLPLWLYSYQFITGCLASIKLLSFCVVWTCIHSDIDEDLWQTKSSLDLFTWRTQENQSQSVGLKKSFVLLVVHCFSFASLDIPGKLLPNIAYNLFQSLRTIYIKQQLL